MCNPSSKLSLWRQHYTCALNKPHAPPSAPLQELADAGAEDASISVEPPTVNEISDAVRKLPRGRASGSDGIVSELLQAAKDSTVPRLQRPCGRIWEEERVPQEWKKGIILSIFKNKGDRRCRSNYRPITLLSVPSKVITAIILKRIQPLILSKRRPQQAGFTPQRSTTDCILTLTVLAQQRRAYRKGPLHCVCRFEGGL